MIPKRVNNLNSTSGNLKTSLYDWDSPSSFTGTVKRRPTVAKSTSPQYPHRIINKPNVRRDIAGNQIPPPEMIQGNSQSIDEHDERTKDEYRRIISSRYDESLQSSTSLSSSSMKLRGKPTKLRVPATTKLPAAPSAVRGSGTKCVHIFANTENSHLTPPSTSSSSFLSNHAFECHKRNPSHEFKELFCDFPALHTTKEFTTNNSIKSRPLPPPYRNPPKAVSCQLPSSSPPFSCSSSATSTTTQQVPGFVNEGKQLKFSPAKRKELINGSPEGASSRIKGLDQQTTVQCRTVDPLFAGESGSKSNSKTSPEMLSTGRQKCGYKGRVSELRNCISRINGKTFFSLAGLKNSDEDDTTTTIATANEYVVYKASHKPRPDGDDDILAKPEFTSSLFKNIPVRPRKGGIPHLDNYYLFDPSVDFINEKELKKKNEAISDQCLMQNVVQKVDQDEDEELIEEIIYDDGSTGMESNYFSIEAESEPNLVAGLESPEFENVAFVTMRRPSRKLPSNKSNSLRTSRSGYSVHQDHQFRNRTIPIESNYMLFKPTSGSASRSAQLKVRKARPLSKYSDADSGFLSPVSPDELKWNPAMLMVNPGESIRGFVEIYTDWANYYLERVRSKRKVGDLSTDCRDGLLLADVIEAVTSFKVPDLVKKPKNQQQMFDNVNACLTALRTHSVCGLETITANDISNGRLKAVLALFFALSRYKQQSKQFKATSTTTAATNSPKPDSSSQPQQAQHRSQEHTSTTVAQKAQQTIQQSTGNASLGTNEAMTTRQVSGSYSKANGGTAIPLPATVHVQRKCPPDKVRPLPPTPNHAPSIPGLAKAAETNTSRPGSPPQNNVNYGSNAKGSNGLRQPQCKIPVSPYNSQQPNAHTAITNAPANCNTSTGTTKHSMLEKLKLFNKEKSSSNNSSSSKSQVSKRTSSSSGFSSARSERSDSSLSLNDAHVSHIKPPSTVLSNTATKNKNPNIKNTKQSKLLGGTSQKATSKETLNVKSSGKHDKKDKSPSRKDLGAASSAMDPIIVPQTNKIIKPTPVFLKPSELKQSKQQSSKNLVSKLETHSDPSKSIPTSASSKPFLISIVPTTGGTGIPKPMAAIKGTSKQTHSIDIQCEIHESKPEKVGDISNSNRSCNISDMNHSNQKMHIINSVSSSSSSATDNLNYFPNYPGSHKMMQSNSISMSDSLHSNSTHSGGGLHSNSSESSVIYRPSSESGSDMYYQHSLVTSRIPPPPINNPIPNRKTTSNQAVQSDQITTTTTTTSANNKFFTVPSKTVGTIYEEDKPQQHSVGGTIVMPMRPLLRGYNSHVTLPTRGVRGHHHYASEYCESDIGQGYCSDGDAFRRTGHTRLYEIDNGYLSEGSGAAAHGNGKHFLSVMRARTQLPTTIEERMRSSRGSIDSIAGTSPSSEASSRMETNSSPNRSRSSRDNWNKMAEPMNNGHHHHNPMSPTGGGGGAHKEKSSPGHSRRNISSSSSSHHPSSSQSQKCSGRTKGVPQSFGYVKRTNGSATGTITATDQQSILLMNQMQQHGGRNNHHGVAVSRSGKIKVSGGTQTCTSDLQTKIPPNIQHRSFSLTGPGASQLSQSIRERLSSGTHSLPKTGAEMHLFQHRISNRGPGKIIDGSLSDTQTYAEVKPEYNTYAMWLKHSNTAGSRLSEGDSLESLQIGPGGITRHGHKLIHRESPYIQSPRLNRSNSIRSTKSEKMYPSMMNRGSDAELEPYYCLPVGTVQPGANSHQHGMIPWSQPTSPTPPNRGFVGPLSPTHAGPVGNMSTTGCQRLTYPKKNDEAHGSAASLLSGGSSLYGSAEERQAGEIRRLKRELTDARDQVMSLSSQLSTNAHVVAAFEQSLSNMTQRLQQLTATAERKDGELTDMRQTIELLRKQSIQAGLTTAHMQSMGVQTNCQTDNLTRPPNGHQPFKSQLHIVQANGGLSQPSIGTKPASAAGMQRHHSTDSMCSLNSISSGCSAQDKKKKKGWLRSSFTKAFSRNAKISKTNRQLSGTLSSLEQQPMTSQLSSDNVATLPPPSPTKSPQKTIPPTIIEHAKPVDAIEGKNNPVVEDLKKQLREKDLVLTDIRLEALSSASQLESLKDTVMKMRAEMITLKQNNERLQKLVTSRSLAGSEASLGNAVSPNGSLNECRRYSLADSVSRPPMELPKSLEEEVEEENIPPAPAPEPPPPPLSPTSHIDLTPPPPAIDVPSPTHMPSTVEETPDHTDGKKISIAVYLGQPESFPKYAEEIFESDNYYSSAGKHSDHDNPDRDFEERDFNRFPNPALNEFIINYTYISGKTTWQNLDYIVRKTFKDYVSRVDPGTNLGLNTDSITSYHLGEAKRGPEMGFPELLPCGYIVGNVRTLYICLQGVGCLAFDSLIPRSIVHRYISLLTEHRRLILCGPSGTGKSYLARKLAEFLVARSGRGNPSEAIASFNVDHKSSKELRQYLGHVAEQASMSNGASELPSVIILDNLHHASALGDVFSSLLSAGPAAKLPCIIGTMSQATCNTTNLQLHHNFRWVLTANHMEPVKGFLGRFLRRRLFTLELSTQCQQPELNSILAWLPTVWQHINRFLENHSSSDVTIGPRLFLACPLDLKESQVWFTDIWNYHLTPYLVEAVREGVQLYGRRGGAWNDPSTFIRDTYPWQYGPDSVPPLRQINAEDVGLEADVSSNNDSQDPLLNMLMRLQEAANYSENQEQESDCASLDSNITQDSSAGAD